MVDAVVHYPGNDKFYLFKGDQYTRHTWDQPSDVGYPKPIVGNWVGWPAGWGPGDVDAVVYYPWNEKFYLFKGDQYARHTWNEPIDAGYPQPIAGHWDGWPAEWGAGDVDAVVYYTGNDKFYLLKDDQYARQTGGQPGYLKSIVGNWVPWPN